MSIITLPSPLIVCAFVSNVPVSCPCTPPFTLPLSVCPAPNVIPAEAVIAPLNCAACVNVDV